MQLAAARLPWWQIQPLMETLRLQRLQVSGRCSRSSGSSSSLHTTRRAGRQAAGLAGQWVGSTVAGWCVGKRVGCPPAGLGSCQDDAALDEVFQLAAHIARLSAAQRMAADVDRVELPDDASRSCGTAMLPAGAAAKASMSSRGARAAAGMLDRMERSGGEYKSWRKRPARAPRPANRRGSGRHQAHIHLARLECSGTQAPNWPSWQRRAAASAWAGLSPSLVEEQRAAMGVRSAGAGGVGWCRRAFGAKQFRLTRRLPGSAAQFTATKGLVARGLRAWMGRAGKAFFADASFAGEQHRHLRGWPPCAANQWRH